MNRNYQPAQQNMRRLYELNTFGRTKIDAAFGDEFDDIWLSRGVANWPVNGRRCLKFRCSMEPTRILIADDEPSARLVLKPALELCGYAVDLAVDGADALAH